MAVDANVLIYERIREEIRNGVTPQTAIAKGFEKAVLGDIGDFSTSPRSIAGIVLLGLRDRSDPRLRGGAVAQAS
jgi:preprotein translocase subunit SecD